MLISADSKTFAVEISTFWEPVQLPDQCSLCGLQCSSSVGTRKVTKVGTTFCL